MEELIPIASKLQDVLGALGQATTLDFPQIVVVGGQSSGKSSVLESIVGRSFLPRGQGIVTRRPLVLQLFTTEEEEWGEFLHHPGKLWKNFAEIRSEIVEDTERLTGTNRGIHSSPIHLKIFSPRVLANLTLVDLPGMAKVAVGDQPTDIADQIRNINLRYIQNPNAIILAVTCANTDLANSDALQLARLVDPNGDRTVGVLTKLDLMDPGTHAVDVLHNRVIPLRRYGHVAVVNRGQRDVDADLSVQLGQQKEAQFFRLHPVYAHDKSLKLGTPTLVKMLNSILLHHLRNCLPELKSRISVMMTDVQSELDALGEPTNNDHSDLISRSQLNSSLLTLLSKFTANFASTLDGNTHSSPKNNIASTPVLSSSSSSSNKAPRQEELSGGARIAYIFNHVFSASLLKVDAFDALGEDEIRTTIANANGTRQALFVPEISFDILVRKQISRLEQPGLQCVDLVYEELQRIASQCEPFELTRFPNLRDSLLQVVNNLLKTAVQPTQLMVSNLVKIELAYINTSHPDFIGGSNAVAQLLEKIASQKKQNQQPQQQQQQQQQDTNHDNTSTMNNLTIQETPKQKTNTLTPVSSSSLDHYLHNNNKSDNDASTIDNARQYHDTVPDEKQLLDGQYGSQAQSVDLSSSIGDYPTSHNTGGIMNFIFRGSAATGTAASNNMNNAIVTATSTTPRTPRNSNSSGRLPNIVQLPQVPDTLVQPSSLNHSTTIPDRESMETEIIKSLLDSYFQIVRKNFIDMVPKTIMYFLVNHVRHAMQNELVSELYGRDDSQLQTLMKEAEDVAMRRKTCMEMKDLLSKALEIVNEVRDYNSFQ